MAAGSNTNDKKPTAGEVQLVAGYGTKHTEGGAALFHGGSSDMSWFPLPTMINAALAVALILAPEPPRVTKAAA